MNWQRALVFSLTAFVLIGAAIIILAIWGVVFDGELLFKILATLGILILVVGFLIVVRSDFSDHKRLKDENFLD